MSSFSQAGTAAHYEDVVTFLESRAAGQVAHVASTLFEHLQGTYELLREWGNPPDVCHAGLCHAVCGTDGFTVTLLDVHNELDMAPGCGWDARARGSAGRFAKDCSTRGWPRKSTVFASGGALGRGHRAGASR